MRNYPIDETSPKIFLIHPSVGFKQREVFIREQLHPLGLDYEIVSECDAGSDSLKSKSEKWFGGHIINATDNIKSCTAKHLSAYEKILERNLNGALILEDDVKIDRRFREILLKSISELDQRKEFRDTAVIISYENTRLRFIERSRRKKGQLLYKGDRDRMAAAYYINNAACKTLLDHAMKEKLKDPIDLEHNKALRNGLITYLWCQPAVATQGSFDGTFTTSLGKKKKFTRFRWNTKLLYHKLLYWLR